MGATDPDTPAPEPLPEPAWNEFARAPLVPVAVAATIGLVADRYGSAPFSASLVTAALAWSALAAARRRKCASAPVWAGVAAPAMAAAHPHAPRHSVAADDIGAFAPDRPAPARVRGTLDEEPVHFRTAKPDPLR